MIIHHAIKEMNKKNLKLVPLGLIILMSIFCIGVCVRHYGMGVQPYYEEKLEDLSSGVQEIYWLEDGTIVEQLYSNSASYMVGVDLILLGTDEESQGTLFIQLCDTEGNLLSQKRENLQEIEAGQFYSVRFLEPIDVSNYEKLVIRIYTEDNNGVPGLIGVSTSIGVKDNIECRVNGELVEGDLAISYLYGNYQYMGYKWKGNGVKEALAASILLVILISLIIMYLIFNEESINYKAIIEACKKPNNIKQMLYIVWLFCIFLVATAVARIRNNQEVPIGVYAYIALAIGVTGVWLVKTKESVCKEIQSSFSNIRQDKGLIIMLLFSTLLRIPTFIKIQLWDGSVYYGELQRVCSNFEYSLAYIWDQFRLCNHYAIVYTLFASTGEFLFPNNITGVHVVMLLLTDCALFCIYKMLRGYWLNLSQKEASIVTILVSVCPLFLGLFSNISPEYLLVIFTIFLFYSEYKNQAIMKVAWLISIMFTKETGLVIAAGYLVAHMAVHLKDTLKQKNKARIRYFLCDFYVMCSVGGIILLCLYVIKQNGLIAWVGVNHKLGGNLITEYINLFPEAFSAIWQKLKILFVLHFEWVAVLIIIICTIYRIMNCQSFPSFSGQISLWGTLGSFILLNGYLLYYNNGRYYIFSAVMIWLLASIFLFKTFKNIIDNIMGFGMSIIVILLLIVQNFYYIDPITNLVFDQYETGKGKMISTESNGGSFTETFTNNFRYTYLLDLVDIMLKESEFSEDTNIVIPYGKDYMYFYEYTMYDKNEKRRVFDLPSDSVNTVVMKHVFLKDILEGKLEEIPERGVMYFLPYIDCDEEAIINEAKQYYEVSERNEISNWGGTLAYYILEKRQ